MKRFEEPKAEIVLFFAADVIATSLPSFTSLFLGTSNAEVGAEDF